MIHNIDSRSDYIIYHRIQPSDGSQFHYLCCPALYLILSGNVQLFLEGKIQILRRSDIIMINSYEGFFFKFENAVVCQFLINLPLFKQRLSLPVPEYFEVCNLNSEHHNHLKVMLSQYISQFNKKEDILNRQLQAFEIFHYITTHFTAEKRSSATVKENFTGLKHIRQAMDFMQQHYNENLTLQDIANHCYVSVPYLSKLFKESFNNSIFNILTQIRLSNAWSDVIYGKNTIESIALANGFSNARAFSKAFLEQYGDYPSICREKGNAPAIMPEMMENDMKKLLLQYQSDDPDIHSRDPGNVRKISVRFNSCLGVLEHHLWNLLFIGDIRHISVSQFKKLLPKLQKTFGYTYAYVSGLISRLMLQSIESAASHMPIVSFVHTDTVLDAITESGLIPCIDLYSLNHGINDLFEYVRLFLQHLYEKYGTEEIRKWYFIPGCCPFNFFGKLTKDETINFAQYKELTTAIKALDPEIKIGSPLLQPGSSEKVQHWFVDFLDYARDHDCIPDFYSIIQYPISHPKEEGKEFLFRQNEDPESMKHQLAQLDEIFLSRPLVKRPVYIIEWNTSISSQDFTNDSIYKASRIFKDMLENYDRAMAYGYSLAYDGLEMFPASTAPIHGGKGLICNNGVKKPAFWAMILLRQMGTLLLSKGDGYFITRKETSCQIYLYNTAPMAMSMSADTQSGLPLVNIINSTPVDENMHPLCAQDIEAHILSGGTDSVCFDIILDGLESDQYTLTTIHLTRQQCRIFAKTYDGLCSCPVGILSQYWDCMTTPEIYCEKKILPTSTKNPPEHCMHVKYSLAPGEIAYIQIEESNDKDPNVQNENRNLKI